MLRTSQFFLKVKSSIQICPNRIYPEKFRNVHQMKPFIQNKSNVYDVDLDSVKKGELAVFKCNTNKEKTILRLGVITGIDSNIRIHPLCLRAEDVMESKIENIEDGELCAFDNACMSLYVDEINNEANIPFDSIIAFLEEGDDFTISQRIVRNRVENPHGEHAEDVFLLDCNQNCIVDWKMLRVKVYE